MIDNGQKSGRGVLCMVGETIRAKLDAALSPVYLEVLNESRNHHVPQGSETHFKVVIVSAIFEGLGRVQRHRRVYGLLADELMSGVHALAIHAYTLGEWGAQEGVIPVSPACRGGSTRSAMH